MTPPPAAAAAPAPAVRPRHPARRGRPAQPSRPRRISGPARPARAARTAQRLPESPLDRLLDRLIRRPPTRAWIGLVAFALIGIVAMQLWVVKLGVGVGRALEHAALLQRENSALAIEDSALASGERVERLAVAKGMVPAPPGALRFDPLRGRLDVRLAVAALAKPTSSQVASSVTSSTSATSAEAPSTAASSRETPSTETSSTETPSRETPSAETPSTKPEASATGGGEAGSAPSSTGGSSEATGASAASAPAGAGGGTQAPGG